MERLDRVEVEVVTIEPDRVDVNFFAVQGEFRHMLGGRAMFAGDRWEVSIVTKPVVRKVDSG